MLIVYASRTNNVKRFVGNLIDEFEVISVDEVDKVEQPYVLVGYTDGFGKVPDKVSAFLNRNENHRFLKGVATSGNIVWGANYGKSAHIISEKYNVPIILKFDLGGRKNDVITFKERVRKLNEEIY